MRSIGRSVLASLTALFLSAPACGRGEPGLDAAPGAAWYRRTRVLDLTGDGRPDSVDLEARGSRPDSLEVTLSLRVGGEEKHRERWGSGYELSPLEPAGRSRAEVESLLRARLDSVLASVAPRHLGPADMRLMAEDSAALAGIEPRPVHGVSFGYGSETTVRLAWDAARSRFVRLWSCC